METIRATMEGCYLNVKENKALVFDRMIHPRKIRGHATPEQLEEQKLQQINAEEMHKAELAI
jgi:hypothetical protein